MTATSFAQQLPPAIAASPDPSPQRAVIDQFVDTQVKKLASPEPATCSAGRATLIAQASITGSTPGFYDQFADAVNSKIIPVASSKDARVRLNAAIVVAKIAMKANNGRLAPATEIFLKDSSDAVALWGLQSAKFVVPSLLLGTNLKAATSLGKATAQAAKDHQNAPAVIEEAYRALLLDPALGTNGAAGADFLKSIDDKMLQGFLPVATEFYAYRVKSYEDLTPPAPTADIWGSLFYVKQKVWFAQTAQQQAQALNLMVALVKGAAKQNTAAKSPELLEILKKTGSAFEVISTTLKSKPLQDTAKVVARFSTNSSDEEINTAVAKLEEAVKGLNLAATAGAP